MAGPLSFYNRGVKRGGEPAATSKAAERRVERRVYTTRSARLVDISPGGLTLETSASLDKDRVYDLVLRVDDHRIPVAARALRLRRWRGVTRASMAFERIFDTDRAYLEQVLVREVAERITVVLR